jgi:tetratricopeptide (TPR) repeat protein
MMAQAQVSLKSYCDEVRDLIKSEAYDEALVTGRYILQHYPKYVEAYQLLAETCLSKGQYDEALDLFARVLSVDPENVSARIGMSKLFEAKGDTASAVLQTREAFDLAPSQGGIRTELHRLLSLRGIEVSRLKLTRQGLGRIYLRGGLYTQAADEFETLLRDDPDQIDVEVSLAEALWRDGQLIRSVEVCQSALNKLPYCLKANLILAETWMRSDREDEGETHLQRVRMVDPEGELACQLLGESTLIPRVSVMLTRMGEVPVPTPEEAAATAEAESEGLPDWLTEAVPQQPSALAADLSLPAAAAIVMGATAAPEAQVAAAEEAAEAPTEEAALEASDLPDWLKKARIDELAAEAQARSVEKPQDLGDLTDVLDEGEVPDWLREAWDKENSAARAAAQPSVAPNEIEPAPAAEAPSAVVQKEADAVADWPNATVPATDEIPLAKLADEPGPLPEDAVSPTEAEEEIPDWLRLLREEGEESELPSQEAPAASLMAEPAPAAAAAAPTDTEDSAVLAAETPDWLRRLREESLESELPSGEPPPTGLMAEQALAAEGPTEVEEPALPVEETPGWLRLLREEGLESKPPHEEELPAGLVAEQALTAELPTEPEGLADAEAEEIPDWLRLLREEGLESELPSEEELAAAGLLAEQAPTASAPTGTEEVAASEAKPPAPIQEEGVETSTGPEPSWMRILRGQEMSLVSQEHLEESGLVQAVAEVEPEASQPEAEEIPVWLREAADDGLVETSTIEASPATDVIPQPETAPAPRPQKRVKPATDWLDVLRVDGLAEAILPEGPAPAEAASPRVETEAITAESTSAAPGAAEGMPTWMLMLRQAHGEAVTPEAEGDQLPQIAESGVVPEAPPEETPTTQSVAEVAPDWLAELKSEAAAGEETPEVEKPAPAVDTTPETKIDAAIIAGYETAVQNNPKDWLTRWKLTQAYAAAGNHEAAIGHCQQLLDAEEMVPQVAEYLKAAVDSGVQTRQVFQSLGDAYFKGGHLEEALDAYRKALSLLY